jgi:hypothetical protein
LEVGGEKALIEKGCVFRGLPIQAGGRDQRGEIFAQCRFPGEGPVDGSDLTVFQKE